MPKEAGAKPPAPATRAVTVPAPEDLQLAQSDALLQLRIGRSAHVYTVIASALLALDGVIMLFFFSSLPSLSSGETGAAAVGATFYLLPPLAAGLALSAIGLVSKWEVYELWPWEKHFSTTVGAVAVNVLLAVVYGLRIAGEGPFANIGLFPWFYAAELAGISVALVGFVLTWTSWSLRQWASAVSAVLPVATALLLFPSLSPVGQSDALAVSLFLSAYLYVTSGSFLHLISSGTRVHERELITSGQSRMFRLADEIGRKEEALHFREAALVKREATVENTDLSVRRQYDSLKDARSQLDDLEEDYRKRSDSLVQKERAWAGRIAEIDGRERQVEDKTKALELREQEIGRLVPQISTRESRLIEQEGALTHRDVELTQRQQTLERQLQDLKESEARLSARAGEIDQRTAELLRREGDIAAREAKGKSRGGAPTPAASQELVAREIQLQQLKATLDEANIALGRKSREASELGKAAEDALARAARKEAELASRDAALKQREAELADLLKAADGRRTQYEAAARDYETRLASLGRDQVSFAQKTEDLDRNLKSLTDREASLTEREARLRSLAQELERQEQDLHERSRSLEAAEAEVSLRRQSIDRGTDLSIAGLAAVAAADQRERPPEPPSRRPRGARPEGVRDLADREVGAGDTLVPPTGRRFADRLPSGIPRLDDLLLGGLPPRSHVVVLGDAFVGKEVVLYSFIAEGLKRGEPVLIVTAARSPEEIADALGVVLPQFREYEQMGMVRWVDASGSGGFGSANRTVVKGADDQAGILTSIGTVSGSFEASAGGAFRVAFLGLSAVLAHAEERGFAFVQNVVGILKPRTALAMYSLEAAGLSEPAVKGLLGRMDGAIVFRQERDKTFLQVKGLGDVETRDWVECRATNRALIIGSFALERIR
jgi:KaiC/GvpD/RAD55 family RecA-like ATPase